MVNRLTTYYKTLPVHAKAAMWFLTCSILQKGFSVITMPFFTRLLNQYDYGLVATYNSWETIVEIFICLRLDYSVFNKGMSKYGDQRDGYVLSMQTTSTFSAIVLLLFFVSFRGFFVDLVGLSDKLCVLLIIQGAMKPAISFWMLKERYIYNYMGFVALTFFLTIVSSIFSLVAVYLAESNKGEVRIIANFLVVSALGLFMYIVNIKNGKKELKFEYIKFALLFNFPLIFHYLSTYILNQSDRIMIQKMVGIDEVGIYGVAYSAAMLMTIVSSSLINAISPWYYEKLKRNENSDVLSVFSPLVFCVSIPVCIFILFAPEFLKLVAPPSYSQALYVIPPVSVSIIYLVLYSFFSISEFHYNANKFSGVISSVAAAVNIAANYIFIKKYGFIAAGYTTMACYMLLAIGHYFYARNVVRKNNQVFFDAKFVTYVFIFSTVFVIITNFLYTSLALRYLMISLALVACFIFRERITNVFKQIRKT